MKSMRAKGPKPARTAAVSSSGSSIEEGLLVAESFDWNVTAGSSPPGAAWQGRDGGFSSGQVRLTERPNC